MALRKSVQAHSSWGKWAPGCLYLHYMYVYTWARGILFPLQLAHQTMTWCFFSNLSGINQSVQPVKGRQQQICSTSLVPEWGTCWVGFLWSCSPCWLKTSYAERHKEKRSRWTCTHDQIDLKQCDNMAVEDFVMKGILSFFEHLQLPVGFLDVNVALYPEYQHGLNTVGNLRVVTDMVERQYHSSRTTMPSWQRKKPRNSTCFRSSNNIANTYLQCSKYNFSGK